MTSAGLLKTEEVAIEFETWTFDPSVLIPDTEEEGLFTFPVEVEALFDDFACGIYAINAEIFEATEVDGKEAFVSVGIQPIAIIADYDDDWEEVAEYLTEGGKVLFREDIFFLKNAKHVMARFS